MKKIVLLLIVLLFPTFVFAKEDVYIKNIELLEGNSTEIEPISFEGLKIKSMIRFSMEGGTMKYVVTIQNDSNKDYEITSVQNQKNGKYVTYSVEFDQEEGNIVKAGKEKQAYITINCNEVEDTDLIDGKYEEEIAMNIDLSNGDNPKTSTKTVLLVILMVAFILLTVGVLTPKKNTMYLLVALLVLIPTTIFAYEKITLEMETVVKVGTIGSTQGSIDCEPIDFPFIKGMTWEELDNSYQDNITLTEEMKNRIETSLSMIKDKPNTSATESDYLEYFNKTEFNECTSTIVYPIYRDDMTEEERAQAEEQQAEADREYSNCINSSTHIVSYKDEIQPQDIGDYGNTGASCSMS